jgi:hypothetical protein
MVLGLEAFIPKDEVFRPRKEVRNFDVSEAVVRVSDFPLMFWPVSRRSSALAETQLRIHRYRPHTV